MLKNRDEIEGLTPAEIKDKYSLPEEPSYVSDVAVPDDTEVRIGDVAANFGGREGATQYELLERIDPDRFTNREPLPV